MFFAYLFGLAVFIFLATMTIYSGFIGAPYFKTPKKAIREILKISGVKPGDKIYDLGAGDGAILIIAEKEFGAFGIGFELSPFVYSAAQLNLFLNGVKKSKIYCRNFYHQNISDADIVFCFLSIHAMEKLKDKFETELKPGTKIISYTFAIHGWLPKQTISGYPGKVYLYER